MRNKVKAYFSIICPFSPVLQNKTSQISQYKYMSVVYQFPGLCDQSSKLVVTSVLHWNMASNLLYKNKQTNKHINTWQTLISQTQADTKAKPKLKDWDETAQCWTKGSHYWGHYCYFSPILIKHKMGHLRQMITFTLLGSTSWNQP